MGSVHEPTISQCRHIHRVMYGSAWNDGHQLRKFPKCPARDANKRMALELKGDWAHSRAKHVCAECQCSRVAGSGTSGEFWGKGKDWNRVGHHGVGYCATHEKESHRRGYMDEFANNHLEAIQGAGYKHIGDFGLMSKYASEKALQTRKTRDNIGKVQGILGELLGNFEGDGKKILTEKAGQQVIPMTDKSKAEMILKFANALSRLELDEFKLSRSDYLHLEELLIRMPRMIQLTHNMVDKIYEIHLHLDNGENFRKELDDSFTDWKSALCDIWSSAKTVDEVNHAKPRPTQSEVS